jgi:hypothetical protein
MLDRGEYVDALAEAFETVKAAREKPGAALSPDMETAAFERILNDLLMERIVLAESPPPPPPTQADIVAQRLQTGSVR